MKLSYSCWNVQSKYGAEQALRISKSAGFDGVDFDLASFGKGLLPDMVSMPHDEFVAYFSNLKKIADEIGLKIPTTHSLVIGYGPEEEKNTALRLKAERDFEASAILGAKYCVVHSVSTVTWGYNARPEFMHALNLRMYRDLIPTAEKFGIYITLESFGGVKVNGIPGYDFFSNHIEMRNSYDNVKTEHKAFCLDSGHTNVAVGGGCLPVQDFIRYFGDRIKVLHLHDNDGFTDQHLLPKQGNIDWPSVFEALDEIGYDGYYNYEIVLRFGDSIDKAVMFLGSFLREFTEKRGKL